MKLKKYSQYVKEELTPLAGEVQTEPITKPITKPETPGTTPDTPTRPWRPIPTTVPAPGTEENPIGEIDTTFEPMSSSEEEESGPDTSWEGGKALAQFADLVGQKIVDNKVTIGDKIVTFGSETNTFLITTPDKTNRNTNISDAQALIDEYPELQKSKMI
jgi:hypothetical protein